MPLIDASLFTMYVFLSMLGSLQCVFSRCCDPFLVDALRIMAISKQLNIMHTDSCRLSPILSGFDCSSENKLQKEHDIAVSKLNEWRRRMENQLQEALQKLKDFASKQSMSEADKYMADLSQLDDQIEFFKEEVRCERFFFNEEQRFDNFFLQIGSEI